MRLSVVQKKGLIRWGREDENIFSLTTIFGDLYLSKNNHPQSLRNIDFRQLYCKSSHNLNTLTLKISKKKKNFVLSIDHLGLRGSCLSASVAISLDRLLSCYCGNMKDVLSERRFSDSFVYPPTDVVVILSLLTQRARKRQNGSDFSSLLDCEWHGISSR